MKIGQLVKFVDHDAGGGFAPSPAVIGVIVSVENPATLPSNWVVLTSSGDICYQWGDELEVIQ